MNDNRHGSRVGAIDFDRSNAVEVVVERDENGNSRKTVFVINGEEIGVRCWSPSGDADMEYELKNGQRHGEFRAWHGNGQLCEVSTYDNGKEHGVTKQYDHAGVLIGMYTMQQGTGLDLWYCGKDSLAEEREYRDGQRHGYERWWRPDNGQGLWEEAHYQNDIEHGIQRKWNAQGKLKRGYPQYFILGEKVSKRE